MPSRKQRRRREKSLRHEYDYVLLDHEGNEIEVDPEERRAEREAKEKQRAATAKPSAGKRPARSGGRVPPEPSWERAFRRGGLMGALILIAFIFLFKNGSIASRLLLGLFYAAAFVPLTYFVDRTAYRSYQRRLAKKG
jgi:hypothetical protein